jgi:DNA invertase Pin-like site-specific DNA recombinase
MEELVAIPTAQYLRMSTEHQQYSLENQSRTISRYASDHGFVITSTYKASGKSGIVLNRRHGLRQLLQDVISGTAAFKAILVYDVSRWGRFQDIDEAAHHEFICRSSGVPVYYCAEPFLNDGSLFSMIMKSLKRMMAGEYSRELSAKVLDEHRRLAALGLRQGGVPGIDFRQLLVSAHGEPKTELYAGQRKSIQEERVRLILGPEDEVRCVQDIFHMYVVEQKQPKQIATDLNRRGVPYPGPKRTQWYAQAVNRILRNPKYMGCNVYGRST